MNSMIGITKGIRYQNKQRINAKTAEYHVMVIIAAFVAIFAYVCHRRLQARLFTLRDEICDTCVRKSLSPTVRTALEGVVEEHEIRTSEPDGNLQVFMDENEHEIVRILQQAVNQHSKIILFPRCNS